MGDLDGVRVCELVHHGLPFDPRVWKSAEALAKHGADVDVVLLRSPGQEYHEESLPFHLERLACPSAASRHPWRFLTGNIAFHRHLKGRRYDVVHANDGSTLLGAALLARSSGAALVYDSHEFFPGYLPAATSLRTRVANALHVNLLVERCFIWRADAVIAVSESIASELQRHYSLETRPTVIRNVPRMVRRADLDRGYLRRVIDVPADRPLVSHVGAVTARRGAESAIHAVARTEDAVLALVGPVDPSYRERLEEVARQLGVSDRVRIAGAVPYDDVVHAVSSSDLVLYLPSPATMSQSIRLSLPNKLFEAVMARVPVVMPALPEIQRVVEQYGIGVCVNPADPQAAALAIDSILASPGGPELDARLDAAADALAWETEQERLFDLYRRVLAARTA
ncbi:MAG TPA: glycosyltransferase [Acidimicrobiales bacterium]|nr:glycosyltransferase [Acidimicrobiales bacterium]